MKKLLTAGLVLAVAGSAYASLGISAASTSSKANSNQNLENVPFGNSAESVVKDVVVSEALRGNLGSTGEMTAEQLAKVEARLRTANRVMPNLENRNEDCASAEDILASAGTTWAIPAGGFQYFSWTGTGVGLNIDTCVDGTDCDTDLYIFDACDTMTELFYRDGNSACTIAAWATYLTQGDFVFETGVDYIIAITDYYGDGGNVAFTAEEGQTGDDPCVDPVVLSCGDNYVGSTVGMFNYVNNSAGDFFFQIDLASDGPVTFDLCDGGTDYDSYLTLWDACPTDGGTLIANNDDSCGLQSQIDATLTAGTYWLVVDGFSASEGNFSLNVTCNSCDPINCDGTAEVEPNDGPNGDGTFGSITSGETVCGTVYTYFDDETGFDSRDTDWYELVITENSVVTADLAVEEFNALMFILDSDAATILYTADNAGICGDEQIVSACLFAGTYYVWVGPNGFTGVEVPANYGLTVTAEACNIDDPCVDPVVLGCGDSYTGSTVGMFNYVNNASGDFFFQIDIDASAPVTFDLCDGGTDYDSYLTLWDGCPVDGGTMIASNDDSCGLQSQIVMALDAGTYWLVVDGYSASEGNFSLNVTCGSCEPVECDGVDEGEPNNGPVDFGGDDTFGTIECGTTTCGTVWADGGFRDADWFEVFTLGDTYMTISAEVEMFDGLVFIMDDAYNIIATINNGSFCEPESYDGEAMGQCLPAGIYYVWMGHNGFEGVADEQAYSLFVDCVECVFTDPCDATITLECNGLMMGSNSDSQVGNMYEDYCFGGEDGPEVWYELEHGGGLMTITMSSPDAEDLDMVLLGSCDPLDCLDMPWAVGSDESITGSYDAGTYYVVVDCYAWTGGDYTFTLETTCGGTIEYLDCQTVAGVDDSWSFGVSEFDTDGAGTFYNRAERFGNVPQSITSVSFDGLSLFFDGAAWNACTEDPMPFYITFYEDGNLPGNVVESFEASLSGVPTGNLYAGVYESMTFTFDLPAPLEMAEGWIGIQGAGDAGCWFLWGSSSTGADMSSQLDQGAGWASDAYDLNYCFGYDIDVDPTIVASFSLEQNYPNPFNPTTTISWNQPELAKANLTVFNIMGEKVQSVELGSRAAGSHSFVWDASSLSSGVYIYTLTVGDFTDTKKAVLLK
jgi:hypothetical protein